jgi:N-acyl-D-aspartate/D-glutamate deacylase
VDNSVAAVARCENRDPWEVVYDAMLGSDGRDSLLFPLLNYGKGSYDGLYDLMGDPLTVQGLGDGGAHSSIVCDASMTTYLLTYWTRDRARGPRLPLEYAVRRLTNDGAQHYGLADRGIIREGMRADINVIDYQNLAFVHPEKVNDLPSATGRLIQRSRGYGPRWSPARLSSTTASSPTPGRVVWCARPGRPRKAWAAVAVRTASTRAGMSRSRSPAGSGQCVILRSVTPASA